MIIRETTYRANEVEDRQVIAIATAAASSHGEEAALALVREAGSLDRLIERWGELARPTGSLEAAAGGPKTETIFRSTNGDLQARITRLLDVLPQYDESEKFQAKSAITTLWRQAPAAQEKILDIVINAFGLQDLLFQLNSVRNPGWDSGFVFPNPPEWGTAETQFLNHVLKIPPREIEALQRGEMQTEYKVLDRLRLLPKIAPDRKRAEEQAEWLVHRWGLVARADPETEGMQTIAAMATEYSCDEATMRHRLAGAFYALSDLARQVTKWTVVPARIPKPKKKDVETALSREVAEAAAPQPALPPLTHARRQELRRTLLLEPTKRNRLKIKEAVGLLKQHGILEELAREEPRLRQDMAVLETRYLARREPMDYEETARYLHENRVTKRLLPVQKVQEREEQAIDILDGYLREI